MWVTVAVGILASLALLAVGRGIDDGRDRLRDDAARVAAASALRAQFDVAESQVRDIAGLFEASRRVEPHEYRAFAAPMLERSDANSFIYLTLVEGDRRAAFERASGVRITERGPDGALRPAGRRDRYLVVTYVVLAGDGRNLEGLDVLGLPGRRALVDRAARTGEVGDLASDQAELQRRARAARDRPRVPSRGGSPASSRARSGTACWSAPSATRCAATSGCA